MAKTLLAPDRVALLLALVPYLRDHGPTPVLDLARVFDVPPATLRELVRFLGMAGVPGETLTYQDEDLFDIDWAALEDEDVVTLTKVVAVDDTPRFAPAETAALIAGLHSLTAVLPPRDAKAARALAQRIGEAFGRPAAHGVSVTAQPESPNLPAVIEAIDDDSALVFEYRDVAGRRSTRTVDPLALRQEGGAWYLSAYCRDRGAERSFRVDQMSGVRTAGPRAVGQGDAARAPEGTFSLIATIPADQLGVIHGFAPEVIAESEPGRLRVRIEAWHEESAVRLAEESRGGAIIESPERARAAVRQWGLRALAAYGV